MVQIHPALQWHCTAQHGNSFQGVLIKKEKNPQSIVDAFFPILGGRYAKSGTQLKTQTDRSWDLQNLSD